MEVFGASSERARAESERARASQAQREETLEDLRLEVIREYFTLLADLALEKVRRSEVANRWKHLDVALGRWRAGLGVASDVTRATSLLSHALAEEARVRAQVALSQVRLGALIGWQPGKAVQPEEETGQPQDTVDLKNASELALKQRQEIELHTRNLEAARAQLQAAEAAFAPSLSSALSYQNRQNPSFGSLALSFEIRFNPYDGGNQQSLEEEAAAEVRRMEAKLELASRKILREVAEAHIRLAAANQSAAHETMQLSEARYRRGLGVFLEVSEAQASLVAAQSELEVARWETWIQYFSLRRAIGLTPK